MFYIAFYNDLVERIGVRELNQQTSRVIDRVKRGEVMEITERGRPVARLVPVMSLPARLEQLVAEGRAVPPLTRGSVPMPLEAGDFGVDVAAALAAERVEEE